MKEDIQFKHGYAIGRYIVFGDVPGSGLGSGRGEYGQTQGNIMWQNFPVFTQVYVSKLELLFLLAEALDDNT